MSIINIKGRFRYNALKEKRLIEKNGTLFLKTVYRNRELFKLYKLRKI